MIELLQNLNKRRHFLFALFIFATGSHAQNDTTRAPQIKWPRGSWTHHHIVLSFGLGNFNVNPFVFYELNNKVAETGTTTNVESKVYHAKVEFACNEHFGFVISGNQGITEYDYAYYPISNMAGPPKPVSTHQRVKVSTLNLRINYHLLHARAIDPYIGIGAGLRIITFNDSPHNKILEPKIPFGFELTLGLRYLVASRVGIYAEAGMGRSLYQAGVSVNIGKLHKK